MTHQPSFLIEKLLDAPVTPPWQYAPSNIQNAAKEADKALLENFDAIDVKDDAEVDIPIVQRAWDVAGKEATKTGKPLPSRDPIDAANFKLQIAIDEELKAKRKLQTASSKLCGLVNNSDLRNQWRINVELRAKEIQEELSAIVATVAVQSREIGVLLGFTHYVGDWGDYLTPPGITEVDPVMALRKLVNAKGWAPAPRANAEARIQQAGEVDTRPAVFIVNDGGVVHTVAAKDVDGLLEQPGYRLASDEEKTRWYTRQGLRG
jgi:hypothetical protein